MSEIVQLKSSISQREAMKIESDNTQSSVLSPQSSSEVLIAQSSASRLDSIRKELGARKGREYWRSLEELADTKEFQELMHREFPENASEWNDALGRRKFLKLMGASLALAGFTACTRQPTEYIAPYVRQPEEIILGKPLYFATATTLGGYATGVLVESHEGRPTKIEGNPDHPASLGATDLFSQATILSLYDPERSQTLTYLGDVSTWANFKAAALASLAMPAGQTGQQPTQPAAQPGGLRILTGTATSPTLAYQIMSLVNSVPNSKWIQYEPAGNDNAREGARLAFGVYATTYYDLSKADVIVSLDSDFLSCGPANLLYARQFADKRKLGHETQTMSRLYAIESTVTSTGAVADNRLPMKPSEIEGFTRALAQALGVAVPQSPGSERHAKWVSAVAKDLTEHRGMSAVIVGDGQPPVVHALAHAINEKLGNINQTVFHTEPIEGGIIDGKVGTISDLVNEMNNGAVSTLLMLGGNPVYTAPADLNFAEAMRKVPLRIHLSLYQDETSELCHWHIPEAHYLESWSDARAFNGLASIVQPLIAPLYSGKTAHEVIAAFSTTLSEQTSYQIVQDYWRRWFQGGRKDPAIAGAPINQTTTQPSATSQTTTPTTSTAAQSETEAPRQTSATTGASAQTDEFNKVWRRALHDGFIAGSERLPSPVSVSANWASATPTASGDSGLEIVFRPDPTIYDGRFANNGWLQELPKPITTLTWDNAAIISPATAARLGLGKISNGIATNPFTSIGGEFTADVVDLTFEGRTARFAVWIQAGHPDDTVTVHFGYGRRKAGKIGSGLGFNAYALRGSNAGGPGLQWFGKGLQLTAVGDTYPLAAIQLQHAIDTEAIGTRDLLRAATFEEYKKNPSLKHHPAQGEVPHEEKHNDPAHAEHGHPSLYPEYDYSQGYKWGMAIDLNACIGCHACIVACQAENNIPIVGKEQVARRRAMHWLRVDAYNHGDVHNPQTFFQPVPCMHCEQAPCEVVCPVAATAHSAEGLNDMVYNRCVGTRYCSNNCPYKVRRFNFLLYSDFYTASLKMLRNPDVSVRSRGVMEKCTYCVQRIQEAKIESEKQNRKVQDGEIVTACGAACPTNAIVFGDINDPNSKVHKLKAQERNYSLLDFLNTQPRTTYLGAVRNPNPELGEA